MRTFLLSRNAWLTFFYACLICSCTSVRQNYSYPVLSDNYHKKIGFFSNRVSRPDHAKISPGKTIAVSEAENNVQTGTGMNDANVPATVKGFGIREIKAATEISDNKVATKLTHKDLVLAIPVVKEGKAGPVAAVPSQHGFSGQVNKGWEKLIKVTGNQHLRAAMIPERNRSLGPGMGVTSFVCGIVGLLVAGIILGIVAIVFGIIGMKRAMPGLAIAGFVLGIIDVVGAIIFISML